MSTGIKEKKLVEKEKNETFISDKDSHISNAGSQDVILFISAPPPPPK